MAGPSELAAPLGGLRQGRLAFRSGASRLRLRSGVGLEDLYRGRFEGAPPQVRVRDGTVSIQYRGLPFDWRSREADLALNTSLPWVISVLGGVGRFDADLEDIDLTRLDLTGGTERVVLSLGMPRGEVPVRFVGGARTIRITRPAGVAIRLKLQGGTKRLQFDGDQLGRQAGETNIASPRGGGSGDRFAIEVRGGSDRIVVSERIPVPGSPEP